MPAIAGLSLPTQKASGLGEPIIIGIWINWDQFG